MDIRISIHALRMERDEENTEYKIAVFRQFQSTRSAWSATRGSKTKILFATISIHALRMERDSPQYFNLGSHRISIHALRMERDYFGATTSFTSASFQSTRSAWSATPA